MGKGRDRKGPRRILIGTGTEHDYQSPRHLPWDEIEAKVGAHFSSAARQVIFDARQCYREALDHYCNAPTLEEAESLRDELIDLCRRLHRIHVVVHQCNDAGPDEDESKYAEERAIERAFDGLTLRHGNNLRDVFTRAAEACLEVHDILSRNPDDFAVITLHRPPEVMAFDEFYGRLVDAGDVLGFQPSEKSARFVRLVKWVAVSVGRYADAATVKGARDRRKKRRSR